MNDHKTITRRSALLGALASTAALAVPVSAQVLPNSTIKAVADEFAAAYVAEHFATVNARSICRAREAAFKSAAIGCGPMQCRTASPLART